MFPSRTPRRLADTLLELADAILRPLPDADGDPARIDGPEPHPHRQPPRIARDRRPGAATTPPQHCLCPLPPRPRRARQAPTRA
jgi:hypothetical protein